MAVTVAQFRQNFIEFADGNRYPNSAVEYHLTFSAKLINTARWGNLADDGVQLMAAHFLNLERRSMDAADRGEVPGTATGPISSRSVDKVSVSYDTNASIEPGAGHWNLTVYGQRYRSLARMFGAAGIQIGVPLGVHPLSSAYAWAGPWAWMIPSPSN